ncbi:hypothetical protein CSPX01_07388 [Colletotrichum filicis]|nr:hypothetical protein CSPX01_07388 [Colletotrichum filicis]
MGGDAGGAMESANHLCPAQRPAPPAPLPGIDLGDYEPLFLRRTILNPPSLSPPSFAISAGSLSPRLPLSVCLYVCSGRRGSFRCFPLFRQLSVWMNPSLDLHRIVTTCKQCRGKRRLLCLSGHTFVYHP